MSTGVWSYMSCSVHFQHNHRMIYTVFILMFFFGVTLFLVLLAVGLDLCLELASSSPAKREAREEWSPATCRSTTVTYPGCTSAGCTTVTYPGCTSAGSTAGSTATRGEGQLPSYKDATKPLSAKPPTYLEANNLP